MVLNFFDPFLYLRNIQSDKFYLILAGKIDICSGNEVWKFALLF